MVSGARIMAEARAMNQQATDTEPEPAAPYIVDEAADEVLRLHLDKFEGPFEVLLYLIKTQEIDIFDIPIATITEQYFRVLDMMHEEDLDVAGEFLVLAATLIQIKARMLVPAECEEDEGEVDLIAVVPTLVPNIYGQPELGPFGHSKARTS